jgi:hypothetical protein
MTARVGRGRRARTSRRFVTTLHKPQGVIQPRVQRVGPEHFGIVSVDCAKARFKWMLCDFYGNVIIPPTTVEHNRLELEVAWSQLQEARQRHELRDLIVAIERTGRYHHVPQRLFAAAGDDVRLVHPFTSSRAVDPPAGLEGLQPFAVGRVDKKAPHHRELLQRLWLVGGPFPAERLHEPPV